LKKKLLLRIIAIIILMIGVCYISLDKSDTKTFKIGDTVEKNGISVTLNSARWEKNDKNTQQEKDNSFMVIDVTIENKTDKKYNIWPILYALNGYYGEILTEESIRPNDKCRVKIAFDEVNDKTNKFKFVYNFYDSETARFTYQAVFIIKDVE